MTTNEETVTTTDETTTKHVRNSAESRDGVKVSLSRHSVKVQPATARAPSVTVHRKRSLSRPDEKTEIVSPSEGEGVVVLMGDHALALVRFLRSGVRMRFGALDVTRKQIDAALKTDGTRVAARRDEVAIVLPRETIARLADRLAGDTTALERASVVADAIEVDGASLVTRFVFDRSPRR